MSFIQPPVKMPFWVKALIRIGDRAAGKKLTPPRILAHYPKALVSSGIFEGLITHKDRQVAQRLLQLIRMQVSFTASCPFCIDMNSNEFLKNDITDEEIEALQGINRLEDISSFSTRERTALEYVRAICRTPLLFEASLIERVKRDFSEREIVIIASTAAQVNYWTRLIQAFGIAPEGFSEKCPILKLDRFNTHPDFQKK
jgi:alkylhydroperoxidase family enzyme